MDTRSALVLYGSETGNAQDVAEELGRTLERLHFVSSVLPADSVALDDLRRHDIVLFAISTTGQGDIPANARKFWRSLLRKKLTPDSLDLTRFAIFGLGDSSYPKFNWAARKLKKRLGQLGATELCPHGEADEQNPDGTDGSFIVWAAELRRCLLLLFPLGPNIDVISEDVLLRPKWLLKKKSAQPSSDEPHDTPISTQHAVTGQFQVTLEKNIRLTPDSHWQDVRHFVMRYQSPIEYVPGDTLTVHPKNFLEDVDEMLRLLKWEPHADDPIQLTRTNDGIALENYPSPPITVDEDSGSLTLRKLLTEHLDITAIPKRSFFATLSHFAKDEAHRERLLEFIDPLYLDELYDYTTRPRRGIIEVLQEFASVEVPWEWAAAVIPVLRGRQFSIASGGELKDWDIRNHHENGSESAHEHTPFHGRIDLLVAIVKYKTIMRKIRRGVCTRYLAELQPGTQISVSIQKGSLHLKTADIQRPVIMIGPGTGLAPMRSLIWERRMQVNKCSNQAVDKLAFGQSVLFFGGRNKDADFFFHDEWQQIKEDFPLKVYTAFSRDQVKKQYVQHVIRDQSALVYDLVFNHGGIVFVCGSSGKMPQAVRETLLECFESEGQFTNEEANAYLSGMEREERYKQETW